MGAPNVSSVGSIDARRPAQHPQTLVVTIAGRLDRSDAARFAELVVDQLHRGREAVVICDVGGIVEPDAAVVDAICRIRLGVRRLGVPLRLRRASPELLDLLGLMGLCDLLATPSRSGIETRR